MALVAGRAGGVQVNVAGGQLQAHQAVRCSKLRRHDHLPHDAHAAGGQHKHRVSLVALPEQQAPDLVRAPLHDLRDLAQQRHRDALEHRQPP